MNIDKSKNVPLTLKMLRLCGMLFLWLIINTKTGKVNYGRESMLITYWIKIKSFKLNLKTSKKSDLSKVILKL